MKAYPTLAAILCMGCASPEQRRHAEIMNAIEHVVRLPSEARPLSQFARVYKYASPTRVVGFYFIPDDQHHEWFCRGAKGGGPTNGQVVLACPAPDGMKAGERRWLDDEVFLPDVDDGGCNYIDVEYNLKSKAVIHADCHGEA